MEARMPVLKKHCFLCSLGKRQLLCYVISQATSQSAMMRSNRHMVFLQEQQSQQNQHCGYPDEMQMSYEAKIQDDLARRLHSAYAQENQQVLYTDGFGPSYTSVRRIDYRLSLMGVVG
jgi:hypothetical protein